MLVETIYKKRGKEGRKRREEKGKGKKGEEEKKRREDYCH
jgi:hypothetical protein